MARLNERVGRLEGARNSRTEWQCAVIRAPIPDNVDAFDGDWETSAHWAKEMRSASGFEECGLLILEGSAGVEVLLPPSSLDKIPDDLFDALVVESAPYKRAVILDTLALSSDGGVEDMLERLEALKDQTGGP